MESKLNPADSATRGLTAKELIGNKQWFIGPPFLWNSERTWPVLPYAVPELPGDDPEVKSEVQTFYIAQEHVLDTMICRYSSWNKLKKAIVWLIPYKDYIIHKFGSQNRKHDENVTNSSSCSVKKMQLEEKQLIKFVQSQVFLKEISIQEADVQNITVNRKFDRHW